MELNHPPSDVSRGSSPDIGTIPRPAAGRRRATIGAGAAPVFTADRRGPRRVEWPRRESNPQSRQALDLAALPVCVLGRRQES